MNSIDIQASNFWSRLLAVAALLGSTFPTSMPVTAQTQSQQVGSIVNQATYTYTDSVHPEFKGSTNQLSSSYQLLDPKGQITGCAGETLADYRGFSVGLYEPNANDPTGTEVSQLVPLTGVSLASSAESGFAGSQPNPENSNPFFFSSSDQGTYSFQLDARRSQLDPGKTYILLVNPAPGSIYSQRRIRLVIGTHNENTLTYTATSLDGRPIRGTDGRTSVDSSIQMQNTARLGLEAALNLQASICQAQEIQILKTSDRAAAEPGDTVIYRISIKNLASASVSHLVVTDTLPLGFNFLSSSIRGELAGTPVPITATHSGATVTFSMGGVSIPPSSGNQSQVLNIAYAALLTPDALRGSGENSAIVQGVRTDNSQAVKDGPTTQRLRLNTGILSDCGTIIGRVFVDKNFDGEQQSGEPGVPNAVIFLDDGTRITTDAKGMFSLANVISGYRTGVLDLSSILGYSLAPNERFRERNGQSRLVHLEPGGLVRMNFAVTPTLRKAGRQ